MGGRPRPQLGEERKRYADSDSSHVDPKRSFRMQKRIGCYGCNL